MIEPTNEQKSAQACRSFAEALQAEGFSRAEAIDIVAAWMARPLPTPFDAAAMDAVMANFAEKMRP